MKNRSSLASPSSSTYTPSSSTSPPSTPTSSALSSPPSTPSTPNSSSQVGLSADQPAATERPTNRPASRLQTYNNQQLTYQRKLIAFLQRDKFSLEHIFREIQSSSASCSLMCDTPVGMHESKSLYSFQKVGVMMGVIVGVVAVAVAGYYHQSSFGCVCLLLPMLRLSLEKERALKLRDIAYPFVRPTVHSSVRPFVDLSVCLFN